MMTFCTLIRIPQLNVVDALQGQAQMKICDPYGYIEDPPLCNKYILMCGICILTISGSFWKEFHFNSKHTILQKQSTNFKIKMKSLGSEIKDTSNLELKYYYPFKTFSRFFIF